MSVNGRPYKQLIDPKVDLANVEWNYFKHNDWILPSKLEQLNLFLANKILLLLRL